RELASVVRPVGAKPIIINAAKGIERKSYKLPEEIVRELWPDCYYFTLIGPGFAEEVMQNTPTLVNLGFEKKNTLVQEVKRLLSTGYFRLRLCEGTTVLELSAALKNIYAISCGLADGLGYRTNTRTLLLTLAIEEMRQLFFRLGLEISLESTAGT